MLQVDDGSTSVLMELMYQHLMDGRTTVAQALRLAMLHLLRHPPSPQWRRPKYWAGFLVVGATTRLRCTTSVEGWIEAVTKKLKELGLKVGPRVKLQSRIGCLPQMGSGCFCPFFSLSADALFTSIFGSTLVSTPHAFHKSSL